jgi:S1-C subfamily serine protease
MQSRAPRLRSTLALVLLALFAAALACTPFGPTPAPTQPAETPPPAPVVSPTSPSRSVADLAAATVQIVAMVRGGGGFTPVWSGSGTIISADGLILTNAHVVDDRYGDYTDLVVAILKNTDRPPELAYLAEIAAVDYGLDLAVIRIVSDLEGTPVSAELPFVTLGDSDSVEIGDGLQILGYPGIGGETVTFTEGAVSGFTTDRGVDGRAWIKTDATIAGGNSGGLGANELGELIGVPTRASAGPDEGDVVDCRPVADTNRDGNIDEFDTCVPIGGFINGLRPVNLALPLIEAARSGVAYQPPTGPIEQPVEGFDLSQVFFHSLVFSDGVTSDDQPSRVTPAIPSGVTNVCAFWDYEGMADGLTWSAYWFVDGELSQEGSILSESWVGGPTGSWWVCIFDDFGLPDGLYELVLEVEEESMIGESVFVGGDHPIVQFTLVNDSQDTIWYVHLSPSSASYWGQDELGPTEVINPGASRVIDVPAGLYDLRVINSDIETIVETYGLDLTSSQTYTVSGQQAAPPTGGAISVTLINELEIPICYVFISPSTSTEWGPDWLGATEVIQPGASRGFAVPTGQNFDFRADDCDHNMLAEEYQILVDPSGLTWTISP